MRVYLDASAFLKTFIDEPESPSLGSYLDGLARASFLSSVLLETEARRAATARGAEQADVVDSLATVGLVEASRALFTMAGLLPVPGLRSLDAIHLATAVDVDADVLVAYDHRLLRGAELLGMATASPT